MSVHVYVIEGIPRSGKNSMRMMVNRRTGSRFVKKSKAATEWLAEATRQLIEQRGRRRKLDGPLVVEMDAYQKSDVCDLDNMIALCLDGLKGVVIEDDSTVCRIVANKAIDKQRPRIEVRITLGAA
jgi:Holliday junction resolvase RusA-like endonuclease